MLRIIANTNALHVKPCDSSSFEIDFHAQAKEILAQIPISEIIAHIDNEELLDAIGEEKCADYFGLTTPD